MVPHTSWSWLDQQIIASRVWDPPAVDWVELPLELIFLVIDHYHQAMKRQNDKINKIRHFVKFNFAKRFSPVYFCTFFHETKTKEIKIIFLLLKTILHFSIFHTRQASFRQTQNPWKSSSSFYSVLPRSNQSIHCCSTELKERRRIHVSHKYTTNALFSSPWDTFSQKRDKVKKKRKETLV